MSLENKVKAQLVQTVCSALQKLGRTHKEIAKSLKSHSVKGRTNQSGFCPLALYLDSLPTEHSFDITTGQVLLYTHSYWDRGERICYLSKAQREFVKHFDAGRYPALKEGN